MRYWTVKVGNKWFVINSFHLILGGILCGGLIFYLFFTLFLSINSNINSAKLLREERKKTRLNAALKKLNEKISIINLKIDSLINIDKKERILWGLPSISEDIRKVGVGGSKVKACKFPVDRTRKRLQELQRKFDFELASFKEIYNEIEKNVKKLPYIPSIWPTYGTVTSAFGPRNGRLHKGIDISNAINIPIKATASGVVSYVAYKKGLGLTIEIDHGFGYKTRYGHLSVALVKQGDFVKRHEVIGKMGVTGRTTGPHLHYEVELNGKTINPLTHIIPGNYTY
jgi:murein DD-endopeptidase MepM/ murein hydrolase activator NlpD